MKTTTEQYTTTSSLVNYSSSSFENTNYQHIMLTSDPLSFPEVMDNGILVTYDHLLETDENELSSDKNETKKVD